MKTYDIVENLRKSTATGFEFRQEAMEALGTISGYDWCGIYRLLGENLVLDAYIGAPTDHTMIPVGRGVCGTAIAERKNQVIADVRAIENYLACSTQTRSEIVVLIERKGQILGQIDIDGHTVGRFSAEDEQMLDQLAELISDRWD